MELNELIRKAMEHSKPTLYPGKFYSDGDFVEDSVLFPPDNLKAYTEYVINHVCNEVLNFNGKSLDD
jgi:hypothetical protein